MKICELNGHIANVTRESLLLEQTFNQTIPQNNQRHLFIMPSCLRRSPRRLRFGFSWAR